MAESILARSIRAAGPGRAQCPPMSTRCEVCRNLRPDNLCAIYETRPAICAEYDAKDCEFVDEVAFDLYFTNEHDLEAWLAIRRDRRRESARRGARTKARAVKASRSAEPARAGKPGRRGPRGG